MRGTYTSPLIVCLSPANKVLKEAVMFCGRLWALRRRYCSGPLLLLVVAVCLFYQTLMVARSRLKSGQFASGARNRSTMMDTGRPFDELLQNPGEIVSALDALQREREVNDAHKRLAVVLSGQRAATDTEVQLYRRVLGQRGYEVRLARYAETSGALRTRHGGSEWTVLLCLSGSEKGCLRRVSFSRLLPQHRVNMIPQMMEAFSDADGRCRFQTDARLADTPLPISPSACGPLRAQFGDGGDGAAADDWSAPAATADGLGMILNVTTKSGAPPAPPGLAATVSVYVLVTSATPLTAFLHATASVRARGQSQDRTSQLTSFFLQHLGPEASHEALGHVKQVIGQVLRAAASTNEEAGSSPRCLLCFQLMTFTLRFSGSLRPVVVKAQADLRFDGLRDPGFDGQIVKEVILEDALLFLLPPAPPGAERTAGGPNAAAAKTYGGCEGTLGLCLPEKELLLLLQFHRQQKTPGTFELLHPAGSPARTPSPEHPSPALPRAEESGSSARLAALLDAVRSFYTRTDETHGPNDTEIRMADSHAPVRVVPGDRERCVDPHLRQLYTDPPLLLSPPFSPWVKAYRAEVPFDVVTVRIRPEPVSAACRVRLDDHGGPRTANYPVGLGNSRINILVTDEAAAGPQPVVMTIYTLHMYRESRPSLPMFGEHVTCGFVQDCGLVVRPGQPCGLEALAGPPWAGEPQASARPCSSGDVPGRWVVPCLSCADNRTCDWREVAWQPEGCYYPMLDHPQLQDCMTDRKVLFIGDSTNRGVMYFLMERVNGTLEAWGKAHDTLLYGGLNHGRTRVSYSYYPQFWLEKSRRPTFLTALEQLIQRSRPLENSAQTVLVVGGVQWLNTNHLKIIREVLEREGLDDIMVVVKSLGMGFHLPVDGIRSLSLRGLQELHRENSDIIAAAKLYGYEAIDTFSITMGRYKEFLQGRCACHFHEVEKILRRGADSGARTSGTGLSERPVLQDQDQDQWAGSNSSSYHVRGAVNQVYSEILLSRLCLRARGK